MRRLKYKFLLVALLCCTQGFSQVSIKAHMKGLAAGTSIYYGPSINFPDIKDSVKAGADGFTLNLPIKKSDAEMYTFQFGKESRQISFYVYLSPGKLVINFLDTSFKHISYTGNIFADQQTEYNRMFMHLADSLSGKKLALSQLEMFSMPALEFVREHPNSPYSTAVLVNIAPNSKTVFSIVSNGNLYNAYKGLTYEAKSNKDGRYLDSLLQHLIKKSSTVGAIAADFNLPDENEKQTSLKDFKGKYILLDFWASWCEPCKASFPMLKQIYKKYKGKQFEIISISIDKDKQAWLNELKKQQFPWVTLWDKGGSNVANVKYGIESIPQVFLIDPQGEILERENVIDNSDSNPVIKKMDEVLKN